MTWSPAAGMPAPPPGPPPATKRAGLTAALVGAVALAVLGVVLVVGTGDRAVPGRATALPAADPPQTGDCLLEDPLDLGDDDPLDTGDRLPALRTAACDGTRYGDVVAVGAATGRRSTSGDISDDRCWSAAHGYLGAPDPTTTFRQRIPVSDVWFVVIGPDERQRAAGQAWSACVVHLPPDGVSAAAMTTDHSLRGAWDRPTDSHLFSYCLDDPDTENPVPCVWTHGAEQVSYWDGDPTVSAESGLADCRTDAIEALGSPAALDRGELAVTLVTSRYADPDGDELITGPEAVTADGDYFVDCMVVPGQPGRQLTGPLRGLGDGPAPLR